MQVALDDLYIVIPFPVEAIVILDAFVIHKNNNATPVRTSPIDWEEDLVEIKNVFPCEANGSAGKLNQPLRADRDDYCEYQ